MSNMTNCWIIYVLKERDRRVRRHILTQYPPSHVYTFQIFQGDILVILMLCPFSIYYFRRYVRLFYFPSMLCPFRPLFLSTLCPFGFISYSMFCPIWHVLLLTLCPFILFPIRFYVLSVFYPIWRFFLWPFVPIDVLFVDVFYRRSFLLLHFVSI